MSRHTQLLLTALIAATPSFGAITGLTVLPPSITYYATPNGAIKTDTAPMVFASGSGTAALTVTPTVLFPSGSHWLSATASSAISAGGAARVSITVNPQGLTVGTTAGGQVVITAGGQTATINVSFAIYQGNDATTTEPDQPVPVTQGSSSSFTASVSVVGVPNPMQDSSTQLAPQTSDGSGWLSATKNGSTNNFVVAINAALLQPGVYGGTIKVGGAPNGIPFNATLDVQVTVSAPGGTLTVDTSPVTFNLSAGGAAGSSQVAVGSSGGAVSFGVTASTTSGGNWLQTNANSSSTPATLTITADPSTAPSGPGTYNGQVQVTAGQTTATIPVSLTLTATATLRADTSSITLSAQQGSGSCSSQNVKLTSSDNSIALPITSKASVTTPAFSSWLTISPSSGNAPLTMSVSCTLGNLQAGSYSATAQFFSVNATNTVSIPVTLNVSQSAGFTVNPPSLTFQVPQGSTAQPQTQQVTVGTTGSNTAFAASVDPQAPWILLDRASGTTGGSSGTLNITVNPARLPSGASATANITISSPSGSSPALTSATIAVTANVTGGPLTTAPLYFVPVTPCHIVDTRQGNGTSGSYGPPALAGQATRMFNLTASGCAGIPSTAKAFSLNVTAIPTGYLGYLTIWPSDQMMPAVSTLNGQLAAQPPSKAQQVSIGGPISNAAIVPAGAGGTVSVYVTDPTDLLIDINGYFDTASSGAFSFYPLAQPCRVADTRPFNGTGPLAGPTLAVNVRRDFPVTQAPACPSSIAAAKVYSVNVGVVPPGPLGSLTMWQGGATQPARVQNISAPGGQITATAALVQAGSPAGGVSVIASDATDVFFDMDGYFAPPGQTGALVFHPLAPCRVVNGAQMTGGTAQSFAVVPSGLCGSETIPATAQAYSFNVTVVPVKTLSFLTLWPTGVAQPPVSTLNAFDGRTVANAAIVGAGTGGKITIYVTHDTLVDVDINGYFSAQ